MKKPLKIGRRSFLRGAAGAALTIPLLPSLLSSPTAAQTGSQKSFISWRITNGQFGHQWYPTNSQASGLTLVEPNVREMMLRDIPGPISTILDDRFDPFRDKMILFKHVDRLDVADHGPENGLFGWSDKDSSPGDFIGLPPSIDQIMANRLFGGATVPLNLSVRWSSSGVSCSFSVAADGSLVMEPGLYPEQAFQRLFSDFTVDETVAERRRDYKRTIVDRVLPHYQSVRDNPRLSVEDRVVLDQHIDHMQTLSQQLGQDFGECAPPASPARFDRSPEAVNAAAQAQVDIAIAALRCGMTRIVNFYLDPDTLMTPELHGVAGGHHGASHNSDAGSIVSIENAHKWHMTYFSDFLTKLDASVDSMGNNLLDQSLVFLNNEIGNQNGRDGNQPGQIDLNHIGLDVQTMIVGSAGGALRTGTFLDLRTDYERNRWTRYVGTAYNRLLVSVMLAMGLSPDDWEVGGQPGYGDMRGAKYDKTPLDQVVIGDMRAMLPRLAA